MATPPKPTTPLLNTVDPNYTGLLMALPLSDGTGTVATDLSGNGYNGALTGVATWFNDPTLGTVLQLDGLSGYVSLNATINTILAVQTTATVAFWIRLRNATPATQQKAGLVTLQAMTGAGAATLYANPADSKGYFSVFRTNTRVNAVSLGATDRAQWHHLAITQVSNGNYIVYINGVAISTTTAEFGVGATVSPPTLGLSTDSGGNYFFDGYIGDFRVWTRLLVPTEIMTLVNNPWALYTQSAQQIQTKIYDVQADVTEEHSTSIRTIEIQPESETKGSTAVSTTVLMADLQIPASFPYSIANGVDARYKPTSPTLYADTITSGLTLAIPFYEGTGTAAADFSGNAANGTLNGTTAWNADATSPFRYPTLVKAPDLSFPASTASVTVPAGSAVESASAITLAAWVVVGTNTGTNMVVMSKVNDPAGVTPNVGATWSYILLQRSDQKFSFQISDTIDSTPANVVVGTGTYTAGTLCHVVATYDNTAQFMKIYVNGVFEAQQADSGLIPYNSSGTHSLRIGSDELSGGQWRWPGRIDDVRIWDRALTAAEVTQLYGGPFGIYTNFETTRVLECQLDASLEHPTSIRTIDPQIEADIYPSTAALNTILMVDATPTAHNSNFGVTSISPILGPPAGGTAVTVRGYNLTGTTQVLVGGVPLTSLVVVNNGTITGVTGAHVAGLVDVTVIIPGSGQVTLPLAYAYTPGFTPTANLGIVGAQLDSGIILDQTFNGETTPNWPSQDTTLSFTLADVPVSPMCIDLYVRQTGQPGGMWMRQGNTYAYTVDMVNKKIIWKASAPFTLQAGDELSIVYLAQGN